MNSALSHSPLRIVIVDDERASRQSLTELLAAFRPDCQVVGEANGVATGVHLIRQAKPDLVLLDVAMEDGSGFDLLELFPNMDFKVIFTTAFDEYALRAFRYNALDYLLKPISPKELVGSIDRARQEPHAHHQHKLMNLATEAATRQHSKIALPSHDGVVFIRLDQIVRLEADGSYTTLFTSGNERYTVAQLLKDFEDLLPVESFFRIHHTHVVNYEFVKKLLKKDGGYVHMEDGSQLPIARRRKDEFMDWLKERGT